MLITRAQFNKLDKIFNKSSLDNKQILLLPKKLSKGKFPNCSHKDKNGNVMIKDNNDGTASCSICKQTYIVLPYPNDMATEARYQMYLFLSDLSKDIY